ncbi:efflux transporter periplasmic adaptor subunit [Terasakiispira papahanaumokuakeensis]|uniref:Efflux transporter periplasmic adaptor subunit n=1 Tax=Terasakiispira papahanaumokuakeensis TaxID=197479 RepID=A0A1E2V6N9_9GAMM|nr:HlyD family secretion protein [Terasakiispira papahanaumokuakeensis]ODC02516.1 efflux transporter periplasmic adaptor subunit [Terasakiispira papahanaumokuakeensis]
MRKGLRILVTLLVVAAAIMAGLWLWHYYLYTPWTRDGRVRAEIITIAPDVSGWVDELSVQDNGWVSKGQKLFTLNDQRYLAAVDKAKAVVANREATLALKRHESERRKQLGREAISAEDQEVAQINRDVAAADLQQAQAALASAEIDLDRTLVRAPVEGHVLNMHLNAGNYVKAGQAVMALVKADSFYVTGYFEETKMPDIHQGDPAEVILMNGDTHLKGHVAGIGRGIADTNTATNNQLLPQVQPTFNWVRLAQRIPVRITLDEVPDGTLLSAGMTATVRILKAPERHEPDAQASEH